MKDVLGMTHDEMHEVFKEWNEEELDSYLIEITRDIRLIKMKTEPRWSRRFWTRPDRKVPESGPGLPR